jgi:hypothetical protein
LICDCLCDNIVGILDMQIVEWMAMGNGQNNGVHHKKNVPTVVGGAVGGLFVADTITLVLIYVFFAINTQPD